MTTFAPLLFGLADLAATEAAPEAQETAGALRDAALGQAFPACLPCLLAPGLRAALHLDGAHPLCRLIAKAEAVLPWADSPAASLQPTSLAAIKSIAELLGPEGLIRATHLRFGLFYQAPDSYYPLHAHEAAETYTLLAGLAEWRAGDQRLTLGPGDAIHHPPQCPHAMRAGPKGFVAIWRWSGDIGFDSYHMLPDPEDSKP